jgi:hypothetical protein
MNNELIDKNYIIKQANMNKSKSVINLSFRDGSILHDKTKSNEIVSNIVNKLEKRRNRNKSTIQENLSLTPVERKKAAHILEEFNLGIKSSMTPTNKSKHYDTKNEETDFCKLFLGRVYNDKNKQEELIEVFVETAKETNKDNNHTDKNTENTNKKANLKLRNFSNTKSLSNKNIPYIAIEDENNSDIKNKIECTFSLYNHGKAIFVASDDTIFSLPIPLVGLNLKKGLKLTFDFKRKRNLMEKTQEINNIISKYII